MLINQLIYTSTTCWESPYGHEKEQLLKRDDVFVSGVWFVRYLLVVSVGGIEDVSFTKNGWAFATSDGILSPASIVVVKYVRMSMSYPAGIMKPIEKYIVSCSEEAAS